MKRKNLTRSTLATSIIALLLCVSMLVGATFAWFTDEVVSGMNTISAGNLDVELLSDGNKVTATTKLFDDVELWEPGVVVYENLQVANVGTLALKYQMSLNFGNENTLNGHKLSEVLKVAVIDKIAATADRQTVLAAAKASTNVGALADFALEGELEAGVTGTEQTFVIFWEPNDNAIDNLYNANNDKDTSDGKELHIEFGVNLKATQKMSEEDSFGNDYDENATHFESIATAEELTEALEAGKSVKLTEDITLTEMITIPADAKATLNLNGKTLTAPPLTYVTAIAAIQNEGTLIIEGEGTVTGSYSAVYSTGNLTVNGGTFTAAPTGIGLLLDNIYGTEPSVAVINGGTFDGIGVFNPTDVTINGGTINKGSDPDGHFQDLALGIYPTFDTGAPKTAKVTLNGGTFNGDIYVYDDGGTETTFVNNGATINGQILDNG